MREELEMAPLKFGDFDEKAEDVYLGEEISGGLAASVEATIARRVGKAKGATG